VVDAMAMGNATRRMNHSGSPNMVATVVNHRGVRRVCLRAKVAIPRDTELTFDYGKSYHRCHRFAVL
jgi:SET domain-containing protein